MSATFYGTIDPMKFEWDESKNAVNIRKHRIDFADVPMIFENPVLLDYDDRQEYDEDRWLATGLLGSIVIVMVFTEPRKNTIRIISARKANKDEYKRYYEESL